MDRIILKNLTKRFNNNEPLYNKINLLFEEGKVYAIVGRSGCGKTTLFNILSGIDEIYDGDIFINNINIKDLFKIDKLSYMQNFVSYIKQDINCFEKLSIKDNLNVPFLSLEKPKFDFGKINLFKNQNIKVNKISKGEQRRINILQGISKCSKLIILDEPTSNLDKQNAINVMERIKELKDNHIVIFSTHNIELANNYADTIIEIDKHQNINIKKKTIDDVKISQHKKIKIKNATKAAIAFKKSEKTNNNIIVTSTIVSLVSSGLLLSLLLGFKGYFKRQIDSTNELTYLTLKSANKKANLNEDEKEEFIKDYKNDEIVKLYLSTTIDDCKINDIPFEIPTEFLNSPCEYCKGLQDNEIIIGIDESTRRNLETAFNCDDLDDYVLSNELVLSFNTNDIYEYKIKEFFIDDKIKLYLNNKLTYFKFHEQSEEYLIGFDIEKASKELTYFIENTCNYSFIPYYNYYCIYKNSKTLIDYKILKSKYTNTIPILNEDNYWLKENNGLLYFNNVLPIYNNKIITNTIFYNPLITTPAIGRNVENNDEILISSLLYNDLKIKSPGEDITLCFNDKYKNYKIVGTIENKDSYSIYQYGSWIYEEFENTFQNNLITFKPSEFIITGKTNDIIKQAEEISLEYPSYYISSYVGDTLNSLNDVLNKVTIGGIIFISLFTFISTLSVISSLKLELINYKKEIEHMLGFGYSKKDLNKIYFRITYKRMIESAIIASFFTYFLIMLTNEIIRKEGIFSDNILSSSILITGVEFIISFIIFSVSYLTMKQNKNPRFN